MSLRRRTLAAAVLLICSAIASRAGGPAFVAGSGFDDGVQGQALVWANGSVQYFTDQGDLSQILPGAQADAFVASAFSVWTGIPGVALAASPGGHLAEDVNGSNIQTNGYGIVTAPVDVTSPATGTPVGIVYDFDGTVTEALLGQGAGGLDDCFTNAVYGGPDNFSKSGNIVHALVVINGVCASASAQLPDVQYRLVRVLGRTLGLGWSQANLNVLTRIPPPTSADFAGFPVMHFTDPISCVPISACYPDAAVPAMDDIDALTRLYPSSVTQQSAGRVYGGLYFTDTSGNAAQQMQGVNVVARLMVSGQPSRQYVVTSVSGFLFCGNAGNIIDGYLDGNGLRYDRWGSNDPSLEGYFDLGQLIIPPGQTIAEYQLSVEALDPYWSLGVGPYNPAQVTPSGSFAPVVVTVVNGSNAERDILMLQDEIAQTHPGSGSTYANPAALPLGGAWGSWISGYGSADFFEFTAQPNRTASVVVTALDENGQPTETKLLPVIGVWELSDQSGNPAPAFTPSPFNTPAFGMTRLDAQFGVPETFRVGVADFRGDGRPDYFYQASLLYSDTVTPARVSLAGGVATLHGTGFNPRLQVSIAGSVAGNNATTLSASASQIQAILPAGSQDGTATIQVTDAVSGAFSQMIDALSYGALATDLLLLLQGAEPATPVGSAAPTPIRVRAVAADGITPVNGATIEWSATNGLQLSVCNGVTSCSVLSDEAGESSSLATPTTTGASIITIALAPASYSPPQSQQATVAGTSSTLDLAAVSPTRWIGQGATIAVPLTLVALNLGAPMANVTVNFAVTKGTASLSAGSAATNSLGFATITANLANQSADVQVNACVAPSNSPCQTFTLFSTPASQWTLEAVSGSSQVVPTGRVFQPLVMRVTDGSLAANPVMGVNVIFTTTLARLGAGFDPDPNPDIGGPQRAKTDLAEDALPILLGSSQVPVLTNEDGLASIAPSAGGVGPCDLFITVIAGASTAQLEMENLAAIVLEQPTNLRTQTRAVLAASPGARVNMQTPVLQPVPEVVLAGPVDVPSSEPEVDLHLSECSESSSDNASDGPRNLAVSSRAGSKDSAFAPCAGSKPGEPKASQKEVPTDRGPASGPAPDPVKAQPDPASSSWVPEDKRSCRSLAGDDPVF